MILLENTSLSVGIKILGAELEFINKDNKNLLWQRNELWMGQSPILFPIVGGLKDGYYLYGNQKYEMPQHGFARLMEFSIIEETKTDEFVEFELHENERTLQMYPFLFSLVVSYQLIKNKIQIKFKVENKGENTMYFSIGGHPAFAYDKSKSFKDYKVSLDVVETTAFTFTPSYVNGSKKITIMDGEIANISSILEKEPTLCLEGAKECCFFSDSSCVKMTSQMPYLAFWQKNPQDPSFLCLEPWCGLPDYDNTNHQIEDKVGIIKLAQNEVFNTGYEIEIK